jgi:hypothetical protein
LPSGWRHVITFSPGILQTTPKAYAVASGLISML